MKFPSSYGLNSLTGSLPEFNLIRHTPAPRPAHAVRSDPSIIHPVSRRKPCPGGLNSPAGFSTKPANPNTRHAGGYSSRRPRAAGALVRLALRPPCLPDERRQPCPFGLPCWLAALALCAGAPVLPAFRPSGALSWCGWYIDTSAPAFAACGALFRALSHLVYTSRAARLVAALWGVALPRTQRQRGRVLGLPYPRLPLVSVSTYERRRAYQHTPTRGRCPPA